MSLPAQVQWLNDLQLALAGIAFAIGAQQVSELRWGRPRVSAGPVSAAALAATVVLVVNWLTLTRLSQGGADALLFLRAAASAALMISTLGLVRALLGDAWSPWVASVIVVLLLGRLVLWVGTDLVFTHRYHDGLPVYGPLLAPITLTLLLLVFSYLPALVTEARTHRERLAIAVGGAASVVLAVWSVLSGDSWTAELLGGYLTLPGLTGIAVALWVRQLDTQHALSRLAQRQRALAEFSQVALVARAPDVDRASMQVLAEQLPRATEADPNDADFRRAVERVWAVATARSQAEKEIRLRATTDGLTGLPNRSEICDRISQAVSGAHPGRTVAVAFANLDRFAAVNDIFGHQAGDTVLRTVANRFKAAARTCDQVGRLGSDEFVVVCSDAGRDDPDALATRLHTALRPPVAPSKLDVHVHVHASIGLAVAEPRDPPIDAHDLLRDAAIAARYAKTHRSPTSHFLDEFRTATLSKGELERGLVGAVSRGEIVVHYQPIVTPDTGRIHGFESLARWQQGSTLIPPLEWIPIAEETGLIHEIGEHVLTTAVDRAEDWNALGHQVSLSVNVSAPQLGTPRLEEAVSAAVKRIPHHQLTLEITESLALDDHARRSLATLQDLGARTALDDFGTGFSALAAVATLPINTLKIDRALTALLAEPSGETIITATLSMAKALNMKVVAEGVETQAQDTALSRLGCELSQGYFYSRPVPADVALNLLNQASARQGT